MRTWKIPRKGLIDIQLPADFSDQFITDLRASIDTDVWGFKGEYLLDSLQSKYTDPTIVPDSVRSEAAIQKWLLTEQRNAKTNFRLFHSDVIDRDLGWVTFRTLMGRIKSLIRRTLGPVPYPSILMDLKISNGASTRVKRSNFAACHKLMGEAHISSNALKHWFACASGTTCLSEQTLTLQENSVLFTVPKNSDIDRAACKEPEINMLMQRSVGTHLVTKLRRVGINLNDQTVNQELARTAVRRNLATIDLSSASDSISRQLVEMLLPGEWYDLLDDLRVHSTMVNGKLHDLEMFSSMGNGFTFELETLLFWAITSTVMKMSNVRGRLSVYGDDIIAPSAIVPRLIRVLALLGFKTNEKKTFWKGPFRESCGKHYLGEFDVSPFYIKRKVSTLTDLINILNKLAEWGGRDCGFIEDPSILAFHHRTAVKHIPPYLWGGVSTDSNTALVTGHAPRAELRVGRTKYSSTVLQQIDASRLVLWYMTKESVAADKAVDTEPKKELPYKVVRSSSGWTTSWKPWFLLEN